MHKDIYELIAKTFKFVRYADYLDGTYQYNDLKSIYDRDNLKLIEKVASEVVYANDFAVFK